MNRLHPLRAAQESTRDAQGAKSPVLCWVVNVRAEARTLQKADTQACIYPLAPLSIEFFLRLRPLALRSKTFWTLSHVGKPVATPNASSL